MYHADCVFSRQHCVVVDVLLAETYSKSTCVACLSIAVLSWDVPLCWTVNRTVDGNFADCLNAARYS